MSRIRKGDIVIVTTGKSKGHVGKVLEIKANKNNNDKRILVEGANILTVYEKPNPNIGKQGGIHKREGYFSISNVAIYNETSKKADRVGYRFVENDTKKVRYFKSSGNLIEAVS